MLEGLSRPTLMAITLTSVAVAVAAVIFRPGPAPSTEPLIRTPAEIAATEPAPVQAYTTTYSSTPRCNAWEISDVAMEQVLDEMIRRGWRPPSQGAAAASLDQAHPSLIQATDPSAPMPMRNAAPAKEVDDDNAALQQTTENEATETPAAPSAPTTAEPAPVPAPH